MVSLSGSLERALFFFDTALASIPRTPVSSALLAGVQDSLSALMVPGGIHRHWMTLDPTRDRAEFGWFERGEFRPSVFFAGIENVVHRHLTELQNHIKGHSAHNAQDEPQPLNRLEWTCSTEVYVHLVRELMQRGYITLPSMNGKLGEGNVTEVFRRLSQAFILSKRDGSELTAEALQRRYNGAKGLPDGKRAKLTLPEAEDVK